MEISASTPLLFQGTILAGGTLSAEIDLGDASLAGLLFADHALNDGSVYTGLPTNGTLSFQVAQYSDNHPTFGGFIRYADLYDDAGAVVSATLPAARCAISTLITAKIAGYRYVKVKSSVAQTNGLHFVMPGRP